MKSTSGKVKYETVFDAFRTADIEFCEKDSSSILVWYDSLKVIDFYSALMPFQIVNRIPEIEYICRKASFITILQNYSSYLDRFPPFYPQSFVLPYHNAEFRNFVEKNPKRYLVKPDNGSLGQGITFIEPGEQFEDSRQLSIAQEYIESYLINGTKFDLRVYVLVASIAPKLRIYVYREGIARFCSQPADSKSVFSCLTNTAVNRQNENVDLQSITKPISYAFNCMRENGVDIDRLWKEIDSAITLSILPIHSLTVKTSHKVCPNVGLPRCFQILGFDILIDKNLKPWVLEVNYRPSLEFDIPEEKELKVQMLSAAMKIAAPFSMLQPYVTSKIGKWNSNSWRSFLEHHPEIFKTIKYERANAAKNSLFKRVFPTKDPILSELEHFLGASKAIPVRITRPHNMPQESNEATKTRLKTIYCVRPPVIKPSLKAKKSPKKDNQKPV